MQESDSHPRVLLVEGPDDKHVVIHLSERSELEQNFWIIEKEGKDKLVDSIVLEARTPGRTVLGIVLDANDNPNARWQALTDRLNRLRQEDHFDLPDLPTHPEPSGTIIEGRLRIGIWLMPDNLSTGELEDFIGSMIPPAIRSGLCPKPISMAFHPTIVSFLPAKSSGPRSTPGWRLERLRGQWAWRSRPEICTPTRRTPPHL